ncbi:MAG TPA: FMN-binding negative transcriptional regulator [Bryobacteraceae bacterium]|jgi:transcriptional regulator|nr:FMN-binding negative transcriptional regulator [Bryobacteraceae bacterium]
MYIPEQFREEDVGVLQDHMQRFNFATLVTQENGSMIASHLPFVLERNAGPYGALRAHLAKKNPQYEHLQSGSEALVIFQGPHAYISPTWYANQRNVPTWNYAVVHAYGTPRLLGDAELIELLAKLVQEHERPAPQGWEFDPEQPWIGHMLRAIAGFEIPITNLQGKFKLNQNRTPEDRRGVIETLLLSEDSLTREVAKLMRVSGVHND